MLLYARLENAIRKAPERVWDEIAPVLGDLAEGRSRLDAIRHPLGFVCLPIVRDDSPEGVCLHYWRGDEAASQSPTTSRYHCHSWELLSHVLAGSVGNQRLELAPGEDYQLFTAVSKDRVDHLMPTGTLTGVSCAEPDFHHAGESYELAAGDFHASVPTAAEVSVTLVLGRMTGHADDLTLGRPDQGEHEVTRVSIGPDEAQRVARAVLRLCPEPAGATG